jgi:hypothetical protein
LKKKNEPQRTWRGEPQPNEDRTFTTEVMKSLVRQSRNQEAEYLAQRRKGPKIWRLRDLAREKLFRES